MTATLVSALAIASVIGASGCGKSERRVDPSAKRAVDGALAKIDAVKRGNVFFRAGVTGATPGGANARVKINGSGVFDLTDKSDPRFSFNAALAFGDTQQDLGFTRVGGTGYLALAGKTYDLSTASPLIGDQIGRMVNPSGLIQMVAVFPRYARTYRRLDDAAIGDVTVARYALELDPVRLAEAGFPELRRRAPILDLLPGFDASPATVRQMLRSGTAVVAIGPDGLVHGIEATLRLVDDGTGKPREGEVRFSYEIEGLNRAVTIRRPARATRATGELQSMLLRLLTDVQAGRTAPGASPSGSAK